MRPLPPAFLLLTLPGAALSEIVELPGGCRVELAASSSAFRVSTSCEGDPLAGGLPTPSITNAAPSPGAPLGDAGDNWKELKADFGAIAINTKTGGLRMADASGEVVLLTKNSFVAGPSNLPKAGDPLSSNDTCLTTAFGYDVTSGGTRTDTYPEGIEDATEESCCEACNNDPQCETWVLATNGATSPEGKNCWLLYGVETIAITANRKVGGALPPPPPPPPGSLGLTLGRPEGTSDEARYLGVGGGGNAIRTLSASSAQARVENTLFEVPYFWSTDGYGVVAVSGVNELPDSPYRYGASWATDPEGGVTWVISAWDELPQADLYLWPASDATASTRSLFALTGAPAKLPLYAFGFLACRWGWDDRTYIDSTLQTFRDGKFPIDAFISDFEWYTGQPDYELPQDGEPDFKDFGFNNATFPDPEGQLKDYHSRLNLRFGGIRKPRLGNSDLLIMAREKDWTIDATDGGYRNLNYSIPEVQEWYSEQQIPLLDNGVDFWWNDEGEATYYTFHYWSRSQLDTLRNSEDPVRAATRYFGINRAYTLGDSRFGVSVWTGDIGPTWGELVNTPGYMLNWALAGAAYTTCDIGGFSGETNALLLTRWLQVGTFMPVMRVHSTLSSTPHFPWLWGSEAEIGMRAALELRMRLLPYHYSNAHALFTGSSPLLSIPMEVAYPHDKALEDVTTQWMDGASLLVAPVLAEDNTTTVLLPASASTPFFDFGTTTTHTPGTTLSLTAVGIDAMPAYVAGGSILPLAPAGLQSTAELPGGPLEVQIYAGSDASFTLVEDDGESIAYQVEEETSAARSTNLVWSDSTKTLTWSVSGNFEGEHTFTQLQAVVFFADAQTPAMSAVTSIGMGGSLSFA